MSDESIQSKGGRARAEKLSSGKLKAIASKAAAARWAKPRASHYGTLDLLQKEITCVVLDDERRVISNRSLALAMGVKGGGRYWEKKKLIEKKGGALLPEYVSASYIAPYIDEDLRVSLLNPINYITRGGEPAQGFEASMLPAICDIWIKAGKNGALKTESRKRVAEKAYLLLRGFSEVGIIALIDEATGYQAVRAKGALAKILEKFISGEVQKWTKTFPEDFYREMFRLRGWEFTEKSIKGKRPSVVGKYTDDLIYERLAPKILDELRRKNPNTGKGHRKHKHHQWLTGDVGHPELRSRIEAVTAIMRLSDNWSQLKAMVDRAYPIIEISDLGIEVEITKSKIGSAR